MQFSNTYFGLFHLTDCKLPYSTSSLDKLMDEIFARQRTAKPHNRIALKWLGDAWMRGDPLLDQQKTVATLLEVNRVELEAGAKRLAGMTARREQ